LTIFYHFPHIIQKLPLAKRRVVQNTVTELYELQQKLCFLQHFRQLQNKKPQILKEFAAFFIKIRGRS